MSGQFLNISTLANESRFISISRTEILCVVGRCIEIHSIDLESSEIFAKAHLGFTSISFNHTQNLVAYATRSIPPTMFLKQRFTEELVEIIHSDSLLEIQYIGFSQTGRKLAVFGKDRDGFSLFIWEQSSDVNSYELLFHTPCLCSGCQVVFDTRSDENKVIVWCETEILTCDVRKPQEAALKRLIKMTENVTIRCLQFDERGDYLLLGLSNGSIAKTMCEDGRMETIYSLEHNSNLQNIFILDMASFLSIYTDGRILILSRSHDEDCHIIKDLRCSHEIVEASLAPDLITLHILLSNGTFLQSPFNLIEEHISKSTIRNIWRIPDFVVDFCYVVLTGNPSSVLVTASNEGSLKVWSMPEKHSSNNIGNLLGHLDLANCITVIEILLGYPVCCVGFNDGSIIFVHFKRINGTDNIQLSTFHPISVSDKPIKLVSFHREQRKIAFVSGVKNDSIFILDINHFNVVGAIEERASTSFLSWHHDQPYLIIGTVDGLISCYSYGKKSIEQLWEYRFEPNFLNVALSCSSFENDLTILSLWKIDKSCKLLHQRVSISNDSCLIQSEPQEFENVSGYSFVFDFIANGTLVICGSSNGTVSCFRVKSDGAADLTLNLNDHASTVVAVRVSPDCSQVGSLGSDGLLCIFNTTEPIVPKSIESSSYAMDHLVVKHRTATDNHGLIKEPYIELYNDNKSTCLQDTNRIMASPDSDDNFDVRILRTLDKIFIGLDNYESKTHSEDDIIDDICNDLKEMSSLWIPKREMIENHLKSFDRRNQYCSQLLDACEDSICNGTNKLFTKDTYCVPREEMLKTYHDVNKLYEEKNKVSKLRFEIERELEKVRWKIDLLKFEEINLKAINIDVKVLSKRSSKCDSEKSLEVKMRQHKQVLDKIQNEQIKTLKSLKLKEQDNRDLTNQLDNLSCSIMILQKENMNYDERNKHPVLSKHLMTKYKLTSTMKAQDMELKKLMHRLEKLREKSFPCFTKIRNKK